MRIALVFTFTCLLLSSTFSQNFRFNEFGIEDGISQNFIYTIDQDAQGYLWVGTGEGLCLYNGKEFTTLTTKDGLAEDVITSSFFDKNNNLWLGHVNGSITKGVNGNYAPVLTKLNLQSTITSLTGYKDEVFFVSQNEGIYSIKNNKISPIGKFGQQGFKSIQALQKDHLVIGTSNGILHLKRVNSKWKKQSITLEGQNILTITKSSNRNVYNVGTIEGGLHQIKLLKGKITSRAWKIPALEDLPINAILQDQKHNLWIATGGGGVVKILGNSSSSDPQTIIYNEETGLESNQIQSIYMDREGAVWIGSFGEGISSLADDYFTFFPLSEDTEATNITAVFSTKNETWFGTDLGIIHLDNSSGFRRYFRENEGLIKDKITDIHSNNHGLWVSTANHGVYKYEKDKDRFKQINWNLGLLQNKVNDITGENDYLWVATQGGLISLDCETYETTVYGTENGLGHNAIQTVYEDMKDNVWVGTYSRSLYKIDEKGLNEYELLTSGQLEVVSIIEDFQGRMWVASASKGVFCIDENDDISHFSINNGLKSNYTYSIYNDVNNNIWVGHQGALSKISKNLKSVQVYQHKEGIVGLMNKRAMSLDENFNLWIGSEQGAIKYDASRDLPNTIPPLINLVKIWVDDKEYDPKELIELPYGHYRIQFEYAGLSFKNPEKITYEFFLEGHDKIHSDKNNQNIATYGRLGDGSYKFEVNAFNANGVKSTLPAKIKLVISAPFWKQGWFIILASLAAIGILILFVNYRERKFKEQQDYLERQLKIKTKEVVEKAEKIEDINKDITDSINYAERIQNSLLPNEEMLKSALPGSFIFFQPKDIVSGDFYFMHKFENRLIVACADCTGHGVPGAMVSMIGATTLRNIYGSMTKNRWKTPEKVLELLDKEVKLMLRGSDSEAHEDEFTAKDGMDLTLCEIDLDTNEIIIASARRRSIALINEEMIDIRGDKRSIGEYDENNPDFTIQKIQVNKGDSLYLFTDGYTDQFGGEREKKLMISGTKEIISGLHHLDRNQYYGSVSSNFNLWMSDYDQIDDVLMIGLLF